MVSKHICYVTFTQLIIPSGYGVRLRTAFCPNVSVGKLNTGRVGLIRNQQTSDNKAKRIQEAVGVKTSICIYTPSKGMQNHPPNSVLTNCPYSLPLYTRSAEFATSQEASINTLIVITKHVFFATIQHCHYRR